MTPLRDAIRAVPSVPADGRRAARRATLALAAAAVVVAAGCEPRRRRTPDDAVVVLIESATTSLDPRYSQSNYDMRFSRLVAPGLVTLDQPDMQPRLELAERIERVDDTTWDAWIRADARFGDGAPVTAGDVAWSYESMTAPGSDSVFARQFRDRFERVEVVGERHVRFHLKAPLATFMTDLDQGIVARHAAAADGKFHDGKVVGAGPYRVVSWRTERAVLEPNPHYHGERPALRVEVRTVRDQAARIVMLVGGSADLIQNAVRVDLVDDVAARDRVEVLTGPSAILTYLMFNTEDAVLADLRVRQAIAHALDRDAIIAAKFGGRAVKATGLLAPGHWAYEPDVPRWERDLDRARRLLDEAGYPAPAGGGPRLRLVYKTSADQFRVALARVIAAQLGEIGIDVEVRAFEFNTFFQDIKKGQFQLATMQTTEITEPDFYFAYFHSSRIPTPAEPNLTNRWRYRSARVDELTDAGRRELDLDRRKAIYAEVQRLVAGDLPVVPLWHEDNVVLANVDVSGYRILPNARFNGLVPVTKAAAKAAAP